MGGQQQAVALGAGLQLRGRFFGVCRGPDGRVRWRGRGSNMVMDGGRTHALSRLFNGLVAAAWHMSLKGVGAVAAGDTMVSKAWGEVTDYAALERPSYAPGHVFGWPSNSVLGACRFDFTGSATVAGAFITTTQTKADNIGILFSAADFDTPLSVNPGDDLEVGYVVYA